MSDFPDIINEAQITCALRFLGYEYVESIRSSKADHPRKGFIDLIQPVVDSLILYESQEDNFAAFFGLQRFLFKWGGEYLTKYSEEHAAFDFLFLHLYRTEPPTQYTDEEYNSKWNLEFKDSIEETAAFVRSSFRRKGTGKKLCL